LNNRKYLCQENAATRTEDNKISLCSVSTRLVL